MAGNLVSQILQSIKPEIVSRIASALGIKATDVEAALAGSVPAILAVLVGVVSKPDGVRRLIDAATQLTGTSVLNSLGAGNVNAVADKGSSALTSLVGGSSLDGLTSAIARYSGLDQGNACRARCALHHERHQAGGGRPGCWEDHQSAAVAEGLDRGRAAVGIE
jgi:hypothetical protein